MFKERKKERKKERMICSLNELERKIGNKEKEIEKENRKNLSNSERKDK